jgi:hypothetical protein
MASTTATATSPAPTASATPAATPIPGLSQNQLRYQIIARFGRSEATPPIFFCDNDFYPVARSDEATAAEKWLSSVNKTADEYLDILAHLGVANTTLTPAQKLLVYREHKLLKAITLDPVGDSYQFSVRVAQRGSGTVQTGQQTDGTITPQGSITVVKQRNVPLVCPICLALGARIDTPGGPVAVQDLRPGMWVWTVNLSGERIAAPVERVSHTPVPADHQIVHVRLSDGRELRASSGHPTTDGRTIGALLPGDVLDGSSVISVVLEPYTAGETYDLLPSGDTGFYWADGVEVASTLRGD